jgi:hypothetical protein
MREAELGDPLVDEYASYTRSFNKIPKQAIDNLP